MCRHDVERRSWDVHPREARERGDHCIPATLILDLPRPRGASRRRAIALVELRRTVDELREVRNVRARTPIADRQASAHKKNEEGEIVSALRPRGHIARRKIPDPARVVQYGVA